MIFNKTKRIPYVLQLFILGIGIFVSVTLFAQVKPLFSSFLQTEDEYVFFGTPSFMTEKEWRIGGLLPFVDSRHRIRFNLHGDDSASFYLYLAEEDLASLSYWFPMTLKPDGSFGVTHSEIHGYRISENEWVVSEISSSYGKLSADTLYAYHIRQVLFSAFWCVAFLGVAIAFFVSLIRKMTWRKI